MGDADQATERADIAPGSTLGRYEVLVPIASGGMARVWAARLVGQGGFTKIVALKTILPELAQHTQFRTMFLDEARIASKLRHPNVCETLDIGEEDGALYLTMEWVDGPSLLQLVRVTKKDDDGGPEKNFRMLVDARVAARIIADASAGLHAAHDLVDDDGTPLKVVHRDVSPHNILVSSGGLVKVTDFGVAKAQGRSHLTNAGEIKGKVSYMAPEQLVAAEDIDRRCDVFALGCVLYEITLGRRAFPGTNEAEIVSAILRGQVAKPSDVSKAYPSELEAIVMRALAPERAARYASADVLRTELEAWLTRSGPPVTSHEVATVVRERWGPTMEVVRERIRAACAPRPPGAPPPNDSMRPRRNSGVDRSEKAVSVDTEATATAAAVPPRRSRAVAMAAAALAAASLVLAAAVWFAISRAQSPLASASPSQSPATAAAPPPASSASAGATPETTTSPRVTFHLTPRTAFLVVDGIAMPGDVDAVQRPVDGKPLRVVVRAEKHEDRIVTIDATSPATIDVVLTPRALRRNGRGLKPAASASASAQTGTPALPNPYE